MLPPPSHGDAHQADDSGAFRVLPPGFHSYGGVAAFCGPVQTVYCFEDNSLVKAAVDSPGAGRVLVTNGGEPAAEGTRDRGVIEGHPPPVLVTRVTGAGDTFMAAHLVAERRGADRQTALDEALRAAATYVSGDIDA